MIEFVVEGIKVSLSEKIVSDLQSLHNIDAVDEVTRILKQYKEQITSNENKGITK